ncbi:MAG TPA: RIP metalloprotease RseP [Puia sp.]|nr:RIP metalloprotease RseP [Puia sp.]
MTLLVIDWASVGIKVVQFIFSFSILVILHELGHFLPARWFKCRVEKFYLFFNPWFSLFKKKIGDTEYGLGWVPFGGYVKISGMIDESMDKEQMAQPAQPWEFRSKPAWQRLIIMLGGVTVNVLLAFTIFIMIMWVWGDRYIPVNNLKYGIFADTLGRKMGLKDGDKIIAVGGKPIIRTNKIGSEIIMNEARSMTIIRDADTMQLAIPPGFISQLSKNRLEGFISIRYPQIVDSVPPKVKIISGGPIQRGDTLIELDGKYIPYITDMYKDTSFNYLKHRKTLTETFKRGNDTLTVVLARQEKEGGSGIHFKDPEKILGVVQINYTLMQAVPVGIKKSMTTLRDYIRNLKLLFTSKEVKVQDNLGSVVSIASVFPSEWDWESFWSLTAIFSILLAFMNVLPIPALDGGHALFTLYEMISGRKPSDKFMEYSQLVGMVLLFGLMAYAMGLDIFRFFR